MKKLLSLLLFFSSFAAAQNNQYAVYIDCYTHKDTIPDNGLKFGKIDPAHENNLGPSQPSLCLFTKEGVGQSEAKIKSFEIAIYYKSGKITIANQMYGSLQIPDILNIKAKDEKRPQKIVVQNIQILIKTEAGVTVKKLPPHTFYRASTSSKKCTE